MHTSTESHHHQVVTSSHSSFVVSTNGKGSSTAFKELQKNSQNRIRNESMSEGGSKSEREELIMKILMMSFEIERKDTVVKNLIKEIESLSNRNSFDSSENLYRVEQELVQSMRVNEDLEFKVRQLENLNKQLRVSQSQSSHELEDKLAALDSKTKSLEITKIELENQISQLKTENKMISYKLVNNESSENNRIRELQGEISMLTQKVEEERKVAYEMKIIIDSSHEEVRILRERESQIVKEYEDRVKNMEKEQFHKEDLKRSQAVASQQKIEMTQQELIRMQQEVQFLRKKLDEEQSAHSRKEESMLSDLKQGKEIEKELISVRHLNSTLSAELQSRGREKEGLARQLNEAQRQIQQLEGERHSHSSEKEQRESHLLLLQEQNESFRERTIQLQEEIDRYQNDIRKLKRKLNNSHLNGSTECGSAMMAMQTSSSLKSASSLRNQELLNLNEIIEQTERLQSSNLKIETLLARHSVSASHGGTFLDRSEVSMRRSYVYAEEV